MTEPPAATAPRPLPRPSSYRPGILLAALIFMLVVSPFVADLARGALVDAALFTLVLCAAALAAGDRRSTLICAAGLLVPTLISKWANHFLPHLAPSEIYLVTGLAFVGYATATLLRMILRAPRVDSQVLCAGVATYLLIGILWALAYSLLDRLSPGSFVSTIPPVGPQ